MGGDKDSHPDPSDLSSTLPAACTVTTSTTGEPPASSAERRMGVVEARRVIHNVVEHPDVSGLKTLAPKVRRRVVTLRDLQFSHDVRKGDSFKDKAELLTKYKELYEPLYVKRCQIVNGLVEVGISDEHKERTKDASEEKGVPEFWLTVMKKNNILNQEIQEQDEPALKSLTDIKWDNVDRLDAFRIEFFFDPNPYFMNSILTKTYFTTNDGDAQVMDHASGTEINWFPEKCLTKKAATRMPRGSDPCVNCEERRSFFDFFSPRSLPARAYNNNIAKQLWNEMERDYKVGAQIKDRIIPQAVLWFTGEIKVEEEQRAKARTAVLETLSPGVKRHVEALQELQSSHDKLYVNYSVEKAKLIAKYEQLYESFYAKRYNIVNGLDEDGNSDEHKEGTEDASEETCVPEFWLTAMKKNNLLNREIREHDEAALKFLEDIKYCRLKFPKGFQIVFIFSRNPYIKDRFLTKTYHMIDIGDEQVMDHAEGTFINWFPGKCLTLKEVIRKAWRSDPLEKYEECESFFNYFSSPLVPAEVDNLDDDAANQLQNLREHDYKVGATLRDHIIPRAVVWFTKNDHGRKG